MTLVKFLLQITLLWQLLLKYNNIFGCYTALLLLWPFYSWWIILTWYGVHILDCGAGCHTFFLLLYHLQGGLTGGETVRFYFTFRFSIEVSWMSPIFLIFTAVASNKMISLSKLRRKFFIPYPLMFCSTHKRVSAKWHTQKNNW